MGGNAPMGAQMVLHATPGVVAVGKVSLVSENRGWRIQQLVVLPLGHTVAAGQRGPGLDGKVAGLQPQEPLRRRHVPRARRRPTGALT